MALPGQSVLQTRVAVEEVRPVIWRRVLVPGSVRLNRLHEMFQAAMGGTDSHLQQVRVDEALYGMHFDDYPEHERDETEASAIGAVGEVRRFFYDHDSCDAWRHETVLENVTSWPLGLKHAGCLDGQRACPPEDVGGEPGYEQFLEVLADPSNEEYEHMVGWSGRDFDLEEFSLAAENIALQRVRVRSVSGIGSS
jgi:hypothetical protein